MTPERWQRVKGLFDAAVAREPAERAAFLAGAAPDLADEVLRLIASDEKAASFLSGPAGSPVVVATGRRIGPYRVIGEIGHGGMGAVLRAVRDDDQYRKEVAIKLVRGGVGPAFAIERFKAERQILAGLEHPNIARLIDGGATEEGWPWFAMELVEGKALDVYCKGLAVRQKLELFQQVCSAVQYAHQRLVIHRDLKPANILVTGEGVPKLLDFGIAKLLGAESAATLTAFPVMTPEYASPEQVKGEAITTASDVYSLGMLLYELLAGHRAYEIENRSPQEIGRVVCETNPPPPGAGGDLDTIVLKAIRKEPARRYPSVHELSEDIRRHLTGAPVLARADTVGYRLSKFVSRHRAGVAAAALVLLSLVAGLAVALRQARIAQARFDDVRKLANALLFDVHDAIRDLPGSTKARQLLVKEALEYLDNLSREAGNDAGLQRELAAAYQRLGDVQGGGGDANLGDSAGALRSYEKALSLRRALSKGAAQDEEALASVEVSLGRVLIITGDLAKAEESVRSGIARLERIANGSDLRNRLAAVYRTLAYIQARRGDEAGAMASMEKAVAASRAYCEAHPDDAAAQANLARVQSELVERLGRRGEHARAAGMARSAFAILDGLIARDANNAQYKRNLVLALNIGSDEIEAAGDPAAATAARRRSVEIATRLAEAEPESQNERIALAYSLHYLGAGLVRGGDAGGLDYLRRALRLAASTAKADPASVFARTREAEIAAELGLGLDRLGMRGAEMCAALGRGVAIWDRLASEGRLAGEDKESVARSRAAMQACPKP